MSENYLNTAKVILCSIAFACAFWFAATVSMQLDAILGRM